MKQTFPVISPAFLVQIVFGDAPFTVQNVNGWLYRRKFTVILMARDRPSGDGLLNQRANT
jgi:hypothetical protein